jgi:gas vesicle protein
MIFLYCRIGQELPTKGTQRMAQNTSLVKGLVIGLLAGGAIGALLGLLYAPKSGRELRADLKEKADDLMDGAEDYLHAARTKAGEIVSEAKRRSDGIISDAKKKAGSLLEDADRVITDARQRGAAHAAEGTRVAAGPSRDDHRTA